MRMKRTLGLPGGPVTQRVLRLAFVLWLSLAIVMVLRLAEALFIPPVPLETAAIARAVVPAAQSPIMRDSVPDQADRS
jgi:hypothetical protein